MDYNTEQPQPVQPVPKGSSMASAAMVLGIISIVSLMCVYPAFIFGGIAIVLAILSRGSSKKLSGQAKTAIITSCISICLSITILVGSVAYIMSNPDAMKIFWDSYNSQMEDMYGSDYQNELPFGSYETPATPQVPSDATDI